MNAVLKITSLKQTTAVLTIAAMLLVPFRVAFAAYGWTEIQPAGDVITSLSIASDSTGERIVAAHYNGRLYTSYDSGANWTERQPAGNMNLPWTAVASDSDGSNIIVAHYVDDKGSVTGRLYTSSDSGANWTERQPAGDTDLAWETVASDSDGSNLIAAVQPGRLYTSSDSGANWIERQPAGDADINWDSVASDASGTNLIAAVFGGRLYTSSDSGANWIERQPAGNVDQDWGGVASDSDGSNLIAGVQAGRLYTSSDSGANWTERQPAGDTDINWGGVASDSDGSNLIAGVQAGRLYISSDSGANWTEEQPSGDIDRFWNELSSNADGSQILADASGARFYKGILLDTTPPTIDSVSPTDDATDIAIDTNLVITFDETVVASSTGNITIYDASDDSVIATIAADDAAVTVDDTEVTINPTTDLNQGTTYYIHIDTGAFEDTANNSFAGISDSTTWNFTTIAAPATTRSGSTSTRTRSLKNPVLLNTPDRDLTNEEKVSSLMRQLVTLLEKLLIQLRAEQQNQ